MKFSSLSSSVVVLLLLSSRTVIVEAQITTTPAPIIDDTSMPEETIPPFDGRGDVCQDAVLQWTDCLSVSIGTVCSVDCLAGFTGLEDWTGTGTGTSVNDVCDEFEATLCTIASCCEACQADFLEYANCLYTDANLGTACSGALDCSGGAGGTPNGNNTNTTGGDGGGNGGGGIGGGGFDQILPECVSIVSNYTQCFQANIGTTCGADDNAACSGDVFADQDTSVYPTCQQVEAAVCAFSACCPPCQEYLEAYILCFLEYDPANVNNDNNGCDFDCAEGGGGGGNVTIAPDTTTTKAPSAADAATEAPANAPVGGGGDVPSSSTAEPTFMRITQSPVETPQDGGGGTGAAPTVPATSATRNNGVVSALWSITAATVYLATVLV